ncbi:hypothetical protein PHLCEN_2v6450 [Hermanssonia centrifuga]|uniref:Uncharacterized protein n=1 Tax=Hermanssonia centrifuga TaxID=98765 RepID=A0A2R6NZU6_9APHY|nr:hypothetical protein PHLCEN_2v6450 [Hermanssonia centrifuga]
MHTPAHLPLRLQEPALPVPTQRPPSPETQIIPPGQNPAPLFNNLSDDELLALWTRVQPLLPHDPPRPHFTPPPPPPPPPPSSLPSNPMIADPSVIANARVAAASAGDSRVTPLPPIKPGFLATSFREFFHHLSQVCCTSTSHNLRITRL